MAIIRQYVNIDPLSDDQRQAIAVARAGRTLRLRATIDPPVENVTVSIEIVPGVNNVTEGQISNPIFVERCAETGRKRAVTNAHGQADVEFRLSLFAGDEFTFRLRRVVDDVEQDAMDLPDTYVVWKRVYYQVTRFAAGPKGADRGGGNLAEVAARNFADAEAELAARRHNIELVAQAPTREVIARQGNVIDLATHAARFHAAAREGYVAAREPAAIKVVLVNQMATAAVRGITYDGIVGLAARVNVVPRLVPESLWVDESMPGEEDWFVEAQWAWTNPLNILRPTWPTFDRAHIRTTGPRNLEITIPRMDEDCTVSVFLRYRCRVGSCPGVTDENTIWLATTNMGSQDDGPPTAQANIADDKFTLVAIHELGHCLGMVHLSQSSYYEGHGHSGPHCRTGLDGGQRAEATYARMPGTCVMFGGPSTPANAQQPRFCAACEPWLRTRLASNLRMPEQWR